MTVQDTLNQRKSQHGDFSNVADVSQSLLQTVQKLRPQQWEELTAVQRDALTMILHKVARIMCGDPNHADHWHDIQGYARLAEERIPISASVGRGGRGATGDVVFGPMGRSIV